MANINDGFSRAVTGVAVLLARTRVELTKVNDRPHSMCDKRQPTLEGSSMTKRVRLGGTCIVLGVGLGMTIVAGASAQVQKAIATAQNRLEK